MDYLGGGDEDEDPKKLTEDQVVTLLDPAADPEEKFKAIKLLQSGSYELKHSDLKEILNNSSTEFININKETLEKINKVTLSDGVLEIDLKPDIDAIVIKGPDLDIRIKDGGMADFSKLNITEETVTGYNNSKKGTKDEDTKYSKTVLNVSGSISFNDFTTNTYIPIGLPDAKYETKRITSYNDEEGFYYDNYQTKVTIYKIYTQTVMYQWVPSEKKQ